MFHGMLEAIKEETLGFLYNAQVETEPMAEPEPELPTGPVADSADQSKVPAGLRARGVPAAPAEVPMVFTGPDESGDAAEFDEGQADDDLESASAGRRSNRRAKGPSWPRRRPAPPLIGTNNGSGGTVRRPAASNLYGHQQRRGTPGPALRASWAVGRAL